MQKKFYFVISIGFLLVACSPDSSSGKSPSNQLGYFTNNQRCYPGSEERYDSCVPIVKFSEVQENSKEYDYMNPYTSELPEDLDPAYYEPPTKLADLSNLQAFRVSPDFYIEEFMEERKGDFGILSLGLVQTLQEMRNTLGVPIQVNSGYRSPLYNKAIGGATWSRHMFGDAVDFYSEFRSLKSLANTCREMNADFVQVYISHVHCDWRYSPRDKAFFEAPSNPPTRPFSFVAQKKSQVLHRWIGQDLEIFVSTWQREEAAPLYNTWTVTTPEGEIIQQDGPRILLEAPTSGRYRIEVSVGQSFLLKKHLDL